MKKTKKQKKQSALIYEQEHGKGSYKKHAALQRGMDGFRARACVMKSKKDYNRQAYKTATRRMIEEC